MLTNGATFTNGTTGSRDRSQRPGNMDPSAEANSPAVAAEPHHSREDTEALLGGRVSEPDRGPTRAGSASWLPWIGWSLLMVGVTIVLVPFRGDLDQAHVALTYLLIVLGASASGGRALGITLACTGFLLIDYYFQPPFDAIGVAKGLDWIVLLAFLATAVVATQLLARARAQTRLAEERAREVDRFATLGAETLNVGRTEDALPAIAAVIRAAVDVERCEITLARDFDPTITPVTDASGFLTRVSSGTEGRAPTRRKTYAAGQPLVTAAYDLEIPLTVRERLVGALRLVHDRPILLSAAQTRTLHTLSYYAALAVERVRLAAEAQHAAALREADQLKDALLAAVSHDLRTPLTTIKALAHYATERGDARDRDNARMIETQADRLNRLVADLLDLSRLNGGAVRVTPEVAAAEDLVGAAMREASSVLDASRLRPIVARDGPLLVGRFDFAQSLRILGNLLENAAKYAPAGSPIDLSLARDDNVLLISVADRGPGVAEADRDRIFEPFFRGTQAVSEIGGAGLGLAIAQRLATAQGGALSYAPRDGGGSVFTLRLPAWNA
ncbi:MAG: DUF4118 domain-containing protein, partial [Gemmatimonadota bacterium]|nr:DUF4118 domain-containing protein [Gemmatimonadota bacterium]